MHAVQSRASRASAHNRVGVCPRLGRPIIGKHRQCGHVVNQFNKHDNDSAGGMLCRLHERKSCDKFDNGADDALCRRIINVPDDVATTDSRCFLATVHRD